MAWDQLSVTRPHLVYILLGAFTTLFMLCSSVIKERLYIGEATVATIFGIIFGPHAANLIDPGTWGNTDLITLEFSRIVLVVQCFAVGVELPKYYMERHWRSVVLLLVPVMTFGWLVTSLFVWAMFNDVLNWLDSLVIAACVTATDPVLASSVVGKGKFAKRVPKHLRDLLSAESGCNDGMAFPFIYLGLYIVRYRPDGNAVAFHWFCTAVLYECIWGATYGVIIGYSARRAIKYAHEHDLIDRESFLVFYFVLALFCAGSGSLLGMDDLLIGFACGVGFSNDGWFLEKTEETHVSNVIDLLINLAFFVYFGTIIPWEQYNAPLLGITPWKLVVISLLVLFFRRIPIMLALKSVIPDVKTWREALFAGHFGPIGVGALFVAILARAELETDSSSPLQDVPQIDSSVPHANIIALIWPITTFLVITSIIVHGSSIAVFTLGKHINTLTITMSYTQANDQNNWMDRLPRIQSRSKSKGLETDSDLEDKLPEYPAAVLPRNFLRRQKEDDNPSRSTSVASRRRRRNWDSGIGPGGPVDDSAFGPAGRRPQSADSPSPAKSLSDTTAVPSPVNEADEPERSRPSPQRRPEPEEEAYREGNNTVIEDEAGDVLDVIKSNSSDTERERNDAIEKRMQELLVEDDVHHGHSRKHERDPLAETKEEIKDDAVAAEESLQAGGDERQHSKAPILQKFQALRTDLKQAKNKRAAKAGVEDQNRPRGPARAFKIGNTVIVEDEDGEVIKKYEIPSSSDRKTSYVDPERTRQRLQKMGRWMGMNQQESEEAASGSQQQQNQQPEQQRQQQQTRRSSRSKAAAEHEPQDQDDDDDDDRGIRFTMEGNTHRLSKADFIKQLQALDPKARTEVARASDAPEVVKEIAEADADEHERNARRASQQGQQSRAQAVGRDGEATLEVVGEEDDRPAGPDGQTLVNEDAQDIPIHNISRDLRKFSAVHETAAERRRRAAATRQPQAGRPASDEDSDDDGTERMAPARRARPFHTGSDESLASRGSLRDKGKGRAMMPSTRDDEEETAAERRRREAALGLTKDRDDSSEESETEAPPPRASKPPGIQFAEQTHPAGRREREPTQTPPSSASQKPTGMFGRIRWADKK